MKYSILIFSLMLGLSACSSTKTEQGAIDMKKTINCATAEGDIRVLMSEKSHTGDQIAAGVSAIVPVSMLAHLAKGDSGENLEVASGDYNEMIDKKIAEIKDQCGIK